MGILGKIEKWLDKRKEESHTKGSILRKRRKGLDVVKKLCKCGNRKMFYYNGKYKCTKCGEKIVL